MFVYFGNNWSASATARGWHKVDCQFCGRHFEYVVQFEGVGEAHSPYFLAEEKSKREAVQRAERNAEARLASEPVPMPCPGCGQYQPDMIRVWKKYDFPLWYQPSWMGILQEVGVFVFAALAFLFLIKGFTTGDSVGYGLGSVMIFPFALLYGIRAVVFTVQSIRRQQFDPYHGSTAEERMAYAQQCTYATRPKATRVLTPIFDEDEPPAAEGLSPIYDDLPTHPTLSGSIPTR